MKSETKTIQLCTFSSKIYFLLSIANFITYFWPPCSQYVGHREGGGGGTTRSPLKNWVTIFSYLIGSMSKLLRPSL